MRYRARFVALAFASFVLSFLGSFLTSGAFPHRLLATALCSLLSFQSNACLANLPHGSGRAVAADVPLSSPSAHSTPAEKVAACLPFVGCVDTPLPDVIKRPVEGAIQGEVYKALARSLGEEAPIVSSAKDIFPTVKSLPGEPFDVVSDPSEVAPVLMLPDGSVILEPGDHAIPLDAYCMKHSASSPSGHRYLLAPLKGKRADIISALNARAVASGLPRNQIQVLSWNIQAGMKYEELTSEQRGIIDALLPEYKEKLSRSFIEELEATYSKFAPLTPGLPSSLNAALERLGNVGQTIKAFKELQGTLKQYGNDYNTLSRLFVSSNSDSGYQKGGKNSTPWSKINDRVYGRLVTEGNFSSPAELQLRVLPSPSKRSSNKEGLAASTRLSQARTDSKSQFATPLFDDPVRLNITKLVADSQSTGIQPLSLSPQVISLLLDFVPYVGVAKGILEAIIGQDLITGEELTGWERLLGIIPGAATTLAARSALRAGRATDRIGKEIKDFTKVVPSSKILGNNLEAAGFKRPPETAAHHIVAGGDARASMSRKTLDRFGIDINDTNNGVFLPNTRSSPAPGAYHPGLHTNKYYDGVDSRLLQAKTRQEAIDTLNDIRNQLLRNEFPYK